MAIARVNDVVVETTPNNDGFTTGAQDTSGANFIIIGYSGAITTSETVTDSKSNTWNPLSLNTDGVVGHQSRLYYAYNATVGSGHTFTITGTDNFPTLFIAWYSGVLSSGDPYDVSGSTENNPSTVFGTTCVHASRTPSTDGQLIWGFCGADDQAPASINGGFTIRRSSTGTAGHSFSGGCADLIQTTATAWSPTWTFSSSDTLVASMAGFQAAAAVAGDPFKLPELSISTITVSWR